MFHRLETRTGGHPRRAAAPAACVIAAVLAGFAVLGGGCGIAGGSASLGPTTTLAAIAARVTIEPSQGPIGTVFTLAAEAMTPGAAVQFEITFPGEGRAYPGNALVVAADGTASATYRATTANQPGPYTVRLTGPQGQLATGEFRVTNGKPLLATTLKPSSTASPYKPTTTVKGGSTTTTKTGSTARSTSTSVGRTTSTPSSARSAPTSATTKP